MQLLIIFNELRISYRFGILLVHMFNHKHNQSPTGTKYCSICAEISVLFLFFSSIFISIIILCLPFVTSNKRVHSPHSSPLLLFSTAARLTRAHLKFCTSIGQKQLFLLF